MHAGCRCAWGVDRVSSSLLVKRLGGFLPSMPKSFRQSASVAAVMCLMTPSLARPLWVRQEGGKPSLQNALLRTDDIPALLEEQNVAVDGLFGDAELLGQRWCRKFAGADELDQFAVPTRDGE